MYYVYILFSLKDQRLYIGYSSDLKRRLTEHSSGLVDSTRNRRPLELLGYEAYSEKGDAIRRERYLKSGGKAHADLAIRFQESVNKFKKQLLKE